MKKNISDWTTIGLGAIGITMGLMGIINPESQYQMLKLSDETVKGSVIPALLGSASLSATYVGIMYIFGTLRQWRNFKHYLIFSRMLMAIGFFIMVCRGVAPSTYIAAGIWEGVGGILILVSLLIDHFRMKRKTI